MFITQSATLDLLILFLALNVNLFLLVVIAIIIRKIRYKILCNKGKHQMDSIAKAILIVEKDNLV